MKYFRTTLSAILSILTAVTCDINVVRQDNDRNGFIEMIGSNGDLIKNSSLTFKYNAPYVEMSTDSDSGLTYLAAFPDGYSFPVLYELDRDLTVTYTWKDNSFTFWDMQYSPKQSTIYGILVTEDFNGGMYGRTLSNYTADKESGTITATELYTLPYMWYVNASSFDKSSFKYYALINNFPGKDNSTLDQQIVVADFSVDVSVSEPSVSMTDIDSHDIMLQFISFSTYMEKLYFIGPSKSSPSTAVSVGILCPFTGKIMEVIFTVDGEAAGPIVTDDNNKELLFYVKLSSLLRDGINKWALYALPYDKMGDRIFEAQVRSVYLGDDFASFGAAGYMTA